MSIPQGIPNCPAGLEYLTMIDQLLVHQKVEVLEGIKKINKKLFPIMSLCDWTKTSVFICFQP